MMLPPVQPSGPICPAAFTLRAALDAQGQKGSKASAMTTPHSLQDRAHHDLVAEHYDALVNKPRQVLSDRIFAQIGSLIPKSGHAMLDLGAGTGHMTVRFGNRFKEAVLVDHSEGMLRQASRNTASVPTRVQIRQEDALEFIAKTKEQFELITCVGFLHHLQANELATLFRSVRGALAPGGSVVLAEPVMTSVAEPRAIQRWNQPSMPTLRKYLALAPAPEEAPVELPVFRHIIAQSGLTLVYERRAWEIFARSDGGMLDRLVIPVLDWLYHDGGVVWFGLASAD